MIARSILAACALALALPALSTATLAQNAPIKIGVLTDEAGPFADSGGAGSTLAAEMAVADFGGTVAGRKIEVIHADTGNKPDVASAVARRWFDNEGVDMIVDLPVTPIAFAVQEVAKAKNKTVMITSSATSDITAKNCTVGSTHWADDTAALAIGTGTAVLAAGGKSWYFIAVDTAFGAALTAATTKVVEAGGGKVAGVAKHPINLSDFASFILQAQNSGAQIIGLPTVGQDFINAVKQAHEFGIGLTDKQRLVGFIVFITDIHALGLETTQGLIVTSGFYWDQNDASRAFAKRFMEKRGKMPTKTQAGTYAAVTHYLKGVKEAGTNDTAAVGKAMRKIPVEHMGKKGAVREDGRVLYDLALYQVKKPGESKGPWDYYSKLRDIPASEAFLPMNEACKL